MHLNKEELFGFAVYVIPEEDSGLYSFGKEVLGYDVINSKNICPQRRISPVSYTDMLVGQNNLAFT